MEEILSNTAPVSRCAQDYFVKKGFIYIARRINLATALEGALKLKEISCLYLPLDMIPLKKKLMN